MGVKRGFVAAGEDEGLKLSGEKQTKNELNFRYPSLSGTPTCPSSLERRFRIHLKI